MTKVPAPTAADRAGADRAQARLLDRIRRWYGVDVTGYDPVHLAHQVERHVAEEGVRDVAALGDLFVDKPASLDRFLESVWVGTTSMFRDPAMFRDLQRHVLPELRRHRAARIWVAGCSTGETVYSLAIWLRDEGLLSRCRLYATDVNAGAVRVARSGVYSTSVLREGTRRYHALGGRSDLSRVYSAADGRVAFHRDLRTNLVFAVHDLTRDGRFGEFDLIVCRNVLVWLAEGPRARAQGLLLRSLLPGGALCLGRGEGLSGIESPEAYERLAKGSSLWRKSKPIAEEQVA